MAHQTQLKSLGSGKPPKNCDGRTEQVKRQKTDKDDTLSEGHFGDARGFPSQVIVYYSTYVLAIGFSMLKDYHKSPLGCFIRSPYDLFLFFQKPVREKFFKHHFSIF
jgi:hypothetical protein